MKFSKKITALFLASALLFSLGFNALAYDESLVSDMESLKDYGKICLTPGEDDTQMRFCWVSSLTDGKPSFMISENEDMSDAKLCEVETKLTLNFRRSNSVTVCELKEDTEYFYSYKCSGNWSEAESFTTSGDAFSAMFVSDPQIGRSGDWWEEEVLRHDTAGWKNTVSTAAENNGIDLILCAGDQVEMALDSTQFNLLLSAKELRNIPFAPTVGNHEFYSVLFGDYYNLPGEYESQLFPSAAAKDYCFVKGPALFMVIDTNVQTALSHESFIRQSVKENPEAKWLVVMLHHSPYDSKGENSDFVINKLTPVFESCGVDLVLSGHAHRYSRSCPILDGEVTSDGEGIVYIEGGCASGSNGKGTSEQEAKDYVAGYVDSKEPTYTMLDFDEDEIKVRTYLAYDSENTLVDETSIKDFEPTGEKTALSDETAASAFEIFACILTLNFSKLFSML